MHKNHTQEETKHWFWSFFVDLTIFLMGISIVFPVELGPRLEVSSLRHNRKQLSYYLCNNMY